MKTRIFCLVVCALILSLSPTISLADRYGYGRYPRVHHQGPGPSYYGHRGYNSHQYRHAPYPPPYSYRPHHYSNNDWVAPVAVLGTALGVMALSQSYQSYNPPPPPQRMCQDTYNHVDQYGRFLYTEYVDRPCY